MIDQGLRNIKTSKFGSFNKLVSGQINTDILISGSSRALCHYDPRLIQTIAGKSAYNIGVNASQIDLQLSVLKTYLAHNIKPGILIQNLDLFSFETTRKDVIYDPGFYMPFLGEGELYEFLETVHADAPKWKNIPLYGYTVPDMRFTWIAGVLGPVNTN